MNKKILKKFFITSVIAILLIMFLTNVHATSDITPGQIKGDDMDITELSFIDSVTDLVSKVGSFIAVGVLMIIGIRYMMGSVEERASYKRSMMPYIIGCFILFGAAYIAPQFKELFDNLGGAEATTESIGNSILGLIQLIGTFISVGALMIMGIKYMMGSVEERASFKKSMVPYIIGAVLLFAAVNITSIIYNAVPKANNGGEIQKPGIDRGIDKGRSIQTEQ